MQPDVQDAPGISGLWAALSLTVETAAGAVRKHYARLDRLYQSMHRVPITGPELSAPGITDQPQTMGPKMGRAWDVKRLTLASADPAVPWTGTVNVYNGLPSSASQVDTFTGPDTHHYPKATVLLTGAERIVLVAGPAFTGACVPGGAAVELLEDCLPEYLT